MGEVGDADLIAAHCAGDAAAFGELVGRYRNRLWGLATKILEHPEDAADAVQEALIAAFRRAHSYRGDASVRTWLCRILVNTCIDRLRKQRRTPVVHTEPPPRRGDVVGDVVTRLSVEAALAELPEHQRLAIVLVDVGGWPVDEVAEILDIPAGTVKSRCSRGRLRLARMLGHLREEI